MSTLNDRLLTDTEKEISLKVRGSYNKDDDFEVLTSDVSFLTKLYLMLWKNYKIQMIRRPKSCLTKCFVPFLIMLVLVGLTAIPDLQPKLNTDAYGLEIAYWQSNTGDAADFTEFYPMKDLLPFPDSTSNANQWIKYIICDPQRVTSSNGRDINPPSYLAIVAKDYKNNSNIQSLLDILENNYGTNSYLQSFASQTIAKNTWFSYQVFANESSNTSTSSNVKETDSEQFVYTNCYLQAEDVSFVNFTEGSLIKYFETEQELNDYITDYKYGNTGYNFDNTANDATRPIGAAIVFNSDGGDDGTQWEYTLRFNSSVIADTSTMIDKFTRNVNSLFYGSIAPYLGQSGFMQLQSWVDQAIMEFIVQKSNESSVDMNTLNAMTREYSKGMFMMPTPSYSEGTYWTFVGNVFPFVLFVMFCYPVITVLSVLIEEKESKIKESVKMMGANNSVYWLSWFIWFFGEFTLIATFVTLLGIAGNVFRYSDGFIIFLWFELFCLSSATFAMLLSVFFDNPKTGSLFGLIAFFAVLIGGQFSGNMDENGKTALCLLAPSCFVTSTSTLIQYEVSIIGLNFDNISDEFNEFKFITCLQMMALDIVIYSILLIYLDQVWPSQYGQKQPFYFFIMPSYWRCDKNKKEAAEEKQQLLRRLSSVNTVENYEKVGSSYGNAVISIRNLAKTFRSFGLKSKIIRAVKGISLDMYRGEVFCLLGHNGAGKTTTISMLTGLLTSTDGNAVILDNDITDPNGMNRVRRDLGVCPQHDVLWKRLTAREHLWLFARLKGVPQNRVDKEIKKALDDTGIEGDKSSDKFPMQMSGGQRRKLSLGIALIGGSQIVFLDEPTSGMDPQSRRITWDLISKEKRNRCIILTTHFMDEADILGDRIAIMGGGQIKCCGTSLYLKQSYGVGYTFTVSLDIADEIANSIDSLKQSIDAFVFSEVPNSESVSLAGSELTYRLPFEQTATFSKLFDILDEEKAKLCIKSYGISVTTLEEVFLKIGHDEGDNIDDESQQTQSQQQVYDDSAQSNNNKIRMDAKDKLEAQNQFKQPQISDFALQRKSAFSIFFIHIYAVLFKRFFWSIRDYKALLCSLFCPVILSGMALGLLTIQIATNQPKIELSTSNWYDSIDDVVIPIANYTGDYPVGAYQIEDNFYEDNSSMYDAFVDYMEADVGNIEMIDIDFEPLDVYNANDTNYYDETLSNAFFKYSYDANISAYPSYYNITKSFQDWLLEQTQTEYYNAFLFMPYSATTNQQKHVYFGINASALHSLPITLNLWNNWILRTLFQSNSTSIKVNNHPLPVTTRQNLFGVQITGFATTTYLVIAFSFIPAGAIYFIVNEKTKLTKHQQLVSGISFSAYWIANFIADLIIGLPASFLVFASIFIFDTTTYEGDASAPFLLIMIMFLWSGIPFTYLLSFLFSSPSKAQLTTILLFIITGIILATVAFVLDLIPSTKDVNDSLKGIYRIFPIYIMTESLFNVSEQALLQKSDQDYFGWDVTGRNFTIAAIEGFAYFGCVLLLEYLSSFPVLLSKLGYTTNRPLTETDDELDKDVLAEKKRILGGLTQIGEDKVEIDTNKISDTVVIAGLRKVYDPAGSSRILPCCSNVADEDKIEAVKNLYFGVKQSEVFGYLGVNGAGKTTTLATLTGERYPSSGNAFIANHPIADQLACRKNVGYCPQFDAIFDLLTAREHLKFYAMIKGLSGKGADEQVKVLLNALTLNKYKNRMAGTYSGGNKRKLSVAVAMIGNPPVIFLDEPSTGMDPVSRRFMWEFISTTMSGRCVILTTHSMEECEALCNRVGIMVNGQLRCIGTAQHLKERFGKGYQLDITLTQRLSNEDEKEQENKIISMQRELTKNFGTVSLIEFNGSRISYELVKDENGLKLGEMFNILEEIKASLDDVIQSYALSQSTLEQIFIRMAKQGQMEKNGIQRRLSTQ